MQKRLDPDEILKQIVKLSMGRHKIYLGMAPGVGKTFRMLQDAVELKKRGIDIVIGYIEMQDRPENKAFLEFLEVIPKKLYKVGDNDFFDLDLESVLERRPTTVIIDELAHNNMPGSLNQKRYQDVQELLKSGISIFSTLNVHQLESIAPIVEKNLNAKINETVPEWVLNQAEEVVLIDISIDELYERLKKKQIYNQEQLIHAMKNFFKRENLNLLRDLALNVLAERVDIEILNEQLEAKIKDRILVAASPQDSSIELINNTAEIIRSFHADLDVVCFLKDQVEENVLNSLRHATKLHNGNFLLVRNLKRSIAEELTHLIKLNRITQVIIGYFKSNAWKDLFKSSMITEILKKTSDIDFIILNNTKADSNIKDNALPTAKKNAEIPKVKDLHWGKLKIYIGMAPGVGKTFKMLQDAKEIYKQGKNVLSGVIDTHGRIETAKLAERLPALPPKLIEHNGKLIPEFDLEAAILAKPEIILVDELAHTNVPKAINNKRYQDVQYLLRAGINVMSTVNIQHIESLNEIVEQVTGIKVRETVPDWIISHANEIVLIDLSPEALQDRLKAGKIYSIDKIEQALTHFFQKKNLIALRELSLREVAESVEHEMSVQEKQIKLLTLIDINNKALRLIRKASRIANKMQAELIIMHISKNINKYSEEKKIIIIELEQLVAELGGDFRLVEGKNIIEEIIKARNKIKPDYIILGKEINKNRFPFFKESVMEKVLNNKDLNTNIWIVGHTLDESK